ncbi:hypothetical protein ACHAXR_006679, partial [Thalassiosira sp. AJA248-18]
MGQAIGKAHIQSGAKPFVNLPRSLVASLSQSVYEVAEGFGLGEDELKKIVQISLHEYFARLSESSIDECSEALFALFSADAPDVKETLIDSFEFLATICVVSGMQLDEKISFIFNLFDFNETGKLNINEATLAFRALVSGTMKISSTSASIEVDVIDKVALEGFELSMPDNLNYSQAMAVEDHSLNKQDFFNYVFNCAETTSLLNHFDDIFIEETEQPRSSACLEKEEEKLAPLRFHTRMDDNLPPDEPWRDQLRFLQSSGDEETIQSPPVDGLSLDWIYGRNVATPAVYCSNGDIIYAAGSTVVKYSIDGDGKAVQEYFMGHFGHVTSIDVFNRGGSLGDVVASADAGNDPKICAWYANTLSSIVTIPSFHQNGTSKLIFSPSGELLLSLGNNELNSVAVYNWQEKKILFTSKLAGSDVYDSTFLASDNSFGLCTKDAVYFWTRLEVNAPYSKHRGVFNRLSTKEVMTAIACVGDRVITGSLSGRVWIWEGRVCTKLVEALRSGPITRLHVPRNVSHEHVALCVATHGGSIHLMNGNLEVYRRLVPNKRFGDTERIIDTMCWDPDLETVLVGQSNNGLYQMSVCNEEDTRIVAIGHHGVQGMATMRNSHIATVGKDRIKVWDAKRHSVLQESSVDATLSCVSYNPLEDQIAVGFGADGTRSSLEKSFVILNGKDLQTIHYGCNSVKSLTVCTYSNDGKLVAFGSADTSIYIHQCTEKGFPLLAKARGHSSPVSSIDFGCENGSNVATILRTNSISGEAMFWTTRGKVQTPLSQRDTVWGSQSCIYTASLERAHNSYEEEEHVTSCCPLSNNEGQSVIVGGSSGNLRVFSSSRTSKPLFLEYKGHSGSIQSIAVSGDDSHKAVHTMSRGDSCLFQWNHIPLSWEQGLPCSLTSSSKLQPPSDVSALDMSTMIEQMDNLDFSKRCERKSAVQKVRPWTRSIVAPTNFVPNIGGRLRSEERR